MKPRIGFLIPRLGITDRGAEVFVYELAKNLRRDFEITIWVRFTAERSIMILDLEKYGIKVKRVSCISETHWLPRLLYAFKPLRSLFKTLYLTPYEIEMFIFSLACLPQLLNEEIQVLFPANGLWGALVSRIIRSIRGTPFVYASLGGIEPLIAKLKPNLYIAINPGIERWLKKYYPQLPVAFISTGVDIKKFRPDGRKAEINLPRPIFVTVSALVPTKRVDLTIKAVGKLKKGSLLIVGDGPMKSTLMDEAQQYLGTGRFLFQSVGYEKLDESYRTADVFTHSAPWEVGWSMVHLEAMATNLPVVANGEENLLKLLGKSGITCDVTNIDEYAGALNKALTYRIDNRPRKSVQDKSWENIATQYKKYLYALLSPKFQHIN